MRNTTTVQELADYLDRRGNRWTTSKDLCVAFRCDRRHISHLAEKAIGRIISSGNGYKVQEHASREEIMAAYGHLSDIIAGIQTRASELMTYYHRALKNEGTDNQPTLL